MLDLTICRDHIKGGLDDEGPGVGEDFVEVGKVVSTVSDSTLASLQLIYISYILILMTILTTLVEIRMRLPKVDPRFVLELFPPTEFPETRPVALEI